MESLIVLLSKAMVDRVEVLEPAFNGLKFRFVLFLQLFLDSCDVLLQFNEFLWTVRLTADYLKAALDIFKQLIAPLHHPIIGPINDTHFVVLHLCA